MNDPETCSHNSFYTAARIGKHTAGEGGPVVAYTAEIRLTCEDCSTQFHFGFYPKRGDEGRELQLKIFPGPVTEDGDVVPGEFRCPQCLFHLKTSTLFAQSGVVNADREAKPGPCPNDGTMMEPMTWKESARDAGEFAEQMFFYAQKLEAAWPESYPMPPREFV